MAGSKAKIEFYGTDELIRKIEKAGGNVEKAIIEALKQSSEKPKAEMLSYIRRHRQTGATEDSFTEEFKSKNDKIYMRIGFDIKRGGLPALFLNYGTPRIQPSFFIDNAIDHNIDSIKEAQLDVLREVFKEAISGVE